MSIPRRCWVSKMACAKYVPDDVGIANDFLISHQFSLQNFGIHSSVAKAYTNKIFFEGAAKR
jgi:hypothetical protein